MIIACPDCNGKLSTSAPSCPHCGYAQKVAPAPKVAGSPAPPPPGEIVPEIVAPSRQVLREAARRQFMQWNYDSFWPMAFGMVIMLAILGLAAIIVYFIRAR
jgi:hypothetical protein